jgi:PAS domain S-box-containing protein
MLDSGSIKLRLPLFIVVLFGAIVGGFAWSADRHLKESLERTAGTRLERASERVLQLLSESVARVRGEVTKAASDPALAQAIARRDSGSAAAARRILAVTPAPATQPVTRSLWSRRCDLVLTVGPAMPAGLRNDCPFVAGGGLSLTRQTDSGAWVQPLVARGGSLSYRVVAPVVGGTSDTLGYLVDTRIIRPNESGRVIGALIGKDVAVLFGNASGPSLWTDLSRQVDGPALTRVRDAWSVYKGAAGRRELGVARDVPLTPWTLLVTLPRATVLEPEYSMLRELALIALACLALGIAGAWVIGRHVTAPLLDLTDAAEDMAHGRYARRVESRRTDELGRLIAAFNRMAAQVEESSEQLKSQALELELQAQEAQDLAHELEVSNQELSEALEEATLARRDSSNVEWLLDEVLVQAPVGIAVFDLDMRYVRLNQATAEIHGVPLAAHFGRRPGEVLPELREFEEPLLAHVLATNERVRDQRIAVTLPNGSRRHWISSCFPIRSAAGEVIGVGTVLVDITAQQELEAQFLQAQKMEAVGRLAGGIAHDFNNLLTVITSYSSMAVGTLRTQDPLYDDMCEIKSAAERAARLTRQLLAFSRKQVMRPQLLNLGQLAEEMKAMLERLIGEDVKLELALAPDTGEVSADPGQLEQVIMNLVVNARDAMPNGGQVTIETTNVAFSTEMSITELGRPAGEYVLLTVTDTGTGMSAETQSNLFEPFFTTKGTGQGTGLGLSTVYGIVKQSGGDIHVWSELGRGTIIRLYLPRVASLDSASARRHTPAEPTEPGGAETILLVEDDAPLRQLASRVLREAGYTVLDSRTPTEAVLTGTHHQGEVHLLLTDVVMPQMSGRTVAELLTRQRPGLSVLYMSGYTDDDVVRRGVLATAETAFLQKPFTPGELLRQVRDTLDARGALDRAQPG